MGEDNIEAYLEALVDESATNPTAKGEGSAGEGNGHSADRKSASVEKKSKRRSRSRDRDRDRGSRDRDQRDRSRDNRDKDRDRERERDRDRDRRDRDKRRRSRSRSRSPRRRSRSRSREKSRSKKRSVSPEDERTKEQKELDELTKDQRTVFVSQLVMKVDERGIKKFFSQFGKDMEYVDLLTVGQVRSVVMIRDKSTNRHKGFAYVEMADLDVIPAVLLMNNQVPDFQKFPILVSASRAEKNYIAKKEGVSATGKPAGNTRTPAPGPNQNRVYMGNLHLSLTESDLKEFLKEFGTVTHVLLQRDDQGVSKGYAFVTFSKQEEAQLVLKSLPGFMLLDRPLKVGPVAEISSKQQPQPQQQPLLHPIQVAASANWKLDDDGGSGMHMNSQSRVALMAKLGQTAGVNVPTLPQQPVVAPQVQQSAGGVTPAVGGTPSLCILVKNMFDPNGESEEGWDLDIKEDVEDECSKHGTVLHSYVETKEPGGLVYLLFSAVAGATAAATALNGRWFAGRMLTVDYLPPNVYIAKFPEAAQAIETLSSNKD